LKYQALTLANDLEDHYKHQQMLVQVQINTSTELGVTQTQGRVSMRHSYRPAAKDQVTDDMIIIT
jgi:hypothetical protein